MEGFTLTSLTQLGWPAAIALALILAILLLIALQERSRRHEDDLHQAEEEYRAAVASRDPDRIALAARRLRDARGRAS
jgi:membrane protein implicated in regulation of membrane protease activity